MINLNNTDYPYYKLFVSSSQIKEDFSKLKATRLKKLPSNNLMLFKADYEKNYYIYKLTDFFSESCRIKCNFENNLSPYEMFNEEKEDIIKLYGKTVDYFFIDDYIYDSYKLCSNFPVCVAYEVYKYFKPKNVLDFSAGWGDRLLASLAYGCSYTGTDPNKNMKQNYENMINFFNRSNKKYKVHQTGFENFKPENNFYDLVFTSPPFFDLENYSSDKTQSMHKYKTLEIWKNKFLFHCFSKSIKALKVGCCMAIYISDYKGVKYVSESFKFMKTLKNVNYLGKISWIGKRVPRNIFVWKKIE